MSDWKEYRKTATVEALLLSGPEDVPESDRLNVLEDLGGPGVFGLEIYTLEGPLVVRFPTYLARGVKGELYPVDADVFEESYVEVGEGGEGS